jgi:hypothetical protein
MKDVHLANVKLTTESFIEKSISIYGIGKYDYSKVSYNGVNKKVSVICKSHGEFLQIAYRHLKHEGCKQCHYLSRAGVPLIKFNALNQDDVIIKFNSTHNGNYIYDKVIYKNLSSKVEIICREHGSFFQLPINHLKGSGCAVCGRKKNRSNIKYTNEQIINKFKNNHGDTYDYSLVSYVNSDTKVRIICRQHGIFSIEPNRHLEFNRGQGCPNCAILKSKMVLSRTTEQFIEQSQFLYDDSFTYENTVYNNSYSKLEINCNTHGKILITPISHFSSLKGCKACSPIKFTIEDFLVKVNIIFGDTYSFENLSFKRMSDKIKIICHKHGEFTKTVEGFLSGSGCQVCSATISNKEFFWLISLNVPKHFHHKSLKIDGKRFNLDALDIDNKIIWEFYGDFFHGAPEKFHGNEINTLCKKSFGSLYAKTVKRELDLKRAGFNIISIWEHEFDKIYKKINGIYVKV